MTADESAKLGSVGAALLDMLMSELVVRRPNVRRSVTVTRRIWVGDASKCSTLILRVYMREGRSQISDNATRVEVFTPGRISNARELTTTARSAGMKTRGEVWNWKLLAAMIPNVAKTQMTVTSPPQKVRPKRVGS